MRCGQIGDHGTHCRALLRRAKSSYRHMTQKWMYTNDHVGTHLAQKCRKPPTHSAVEQARQQVESQPMIGESKQSAVEAGRVPGGKRVHLPKLRQREAAKAGKGVDDPHLVLG